jgi:hypothetical protein
MEAMTRWTDGKLWEIARDFGKAFSVQSYGGVFLVSFRDPGLAASWKEGASMRIACKFCRLQALGQPCVAHVQASQTRIDPKMEGSKTRTPAASRTVVIVDKFLGLHGAMQDF